MSEALYFYARPNRPNWKSTVAKCQRQLLRELLKGKTVDQAESAMFTRFTNVSNTYWREFWAEVTNVPVEQAVLG